MNRIIQWGDPPSECAAPILSASQLRLYSGPWLWTTMPRTFQLTCLLAAPSLVSAAISMGSLSVDSAFDWLLLAYQLWNCHSLLLMTLGGALFLLPHMTELYEACKHAAGGGHYYRLIGSGDERVYEKINCWNSDTFDPEWIQHCSVPPSLGCAAHTATTGTVIASGPQAVAAAAVARDSPDRDVRMATSHGQHSFRLLNRW